jgi:CHAT domain-containing protein
MDRVCLLKEEDATEAKFAERSRTADLIHLATHAAFRPDNPFFSWVRLADGRPTVADLYRLRLAGRPIITLSACETGLGGRRGGGLIGLSRALMFAGARGTIVSLWKVDDASTADLMARLYEALVEGYPVRRALRTAQLDTLQRREHPLFWAGFILIEHPTKSHS